MGDVLKTVTKTGPGTASRTVRPGTPLEEGTTGKTKNKSGLMVALATVIAISPVLCAQGSVTKNRAGNTDKPVVAVQPAKDNAGSQFFYVLGLAGAAGGVIALYLRRQRRREEEIQRAESRARLRKAIDLEQWAQANIWAGEKPPVKEGWIGFDYEWHILGARGVDYRLLQEELSTGWRIPKHAHPDSIPPWIADSESGMATWNITTRIWVFRDRLPEFLNLFHPSEPGQYTKIPFPSNGFDLADDEEGKVFPLSAGYVSTLRSINLEIRPVTRAP